MIVLAIFRKAKTSIATVRLDWLHHYHPRLGVLQGTMSTSRAGAPIHSQHFYSPGSSLHTTVQYYYTTVLVVELDLVASRPHQRRGVYSGTASLGRVQYWTCRLRLELRPCSLLKLLLMSVLRCLDRVDCDSGRPGRQGRLVQQSTRSGTGQGSKQQVGVLLHCTMKSCAIIPKLKY